MGISRRQYAAQRGVSETAVRKAIAAGRISVEADGTIDPVKANRDWAAQTNLAHPRGPGSQGKPVPNAAIRAVADTLRDSGDDPPDAPSGDVSFMRARMANEVLKAQTGRIKLQKLKGELVDRARATALVFDIARRQRDAWLNWPPRIAANMAAELGVEAHAMEQVLDRYLRAHLAEMAEVAVELR